MEQPALNFLPNWRIDYVRATSESFLDTIYTSSGTAFKGVTLCYACTVWNNWHAMTTPPNSPIFDNTNLA